MPFIKIATGRSWTHGGQKIEGVQEVAADVAARAQVVAARFEWDWLTVHEDRPADDKTNPSARSGKLTMADIKLGTEGAAAAAQSDAETAAADAARAAAAAVTAAADIDTPPLPYACEHADCDEAFPTKAARTRHANVNHQPVTVETAATTPEPPAAVAAEVLAADATAAPQGDGNAPATDDGAATPAADVTNDDDGQE